MVEKVEKRAKMMQRRKRCVGVHDGVFHADEVTACALLITFGLVDRDKIVRTRDQEVLAGCEYVCDVGGVYDPEQKLFDHHQETYRGTLSSAGMILAYLQSRKVITLKQYEYLNESFVHGVDEHDNGRITPLWGHASFSTIIAGFVPPQYEVSKEEQKEAFLQAVDFVIGHIARLLKRFDYIHSCRSLVADLMDKSQDALIFEKAVPWMESFFELGGAKHPAKFVIMPVGNHWKLRGIPPTYQDRMNTRVPLPRAWAGLMDEELQEVTGIDGAVFCHKGRFVSVWKTKEDALEALAITLQQGESS